MGRVAPKIHKHLSADALFALLLKAFSNLSDHRAGTPDIALSDALMSAFAMFSLKAPSLLAFDLRKDTLYLKRLENQRETGHV